MKSKRHGSMKRPTGGKFASQGPKPKGKGKGAPRGKRGGIRS